MKLALKRIRFEDEKTITIKVKGGYNTLHLEIENSCDGIVPLDSDGHPFSSDKNHGVGTRSVLAFVNRTDSEIHYLSEEGRFRVRMVI